MIKNKKKIRTNISEAQLKNELILLFEQGNTDKGNIWELIRTKYKIQKQRFYRIINQQLIEWDLTKEKAAGEQIHANLTESLKSGLKNKIARQLELQNMLEPNYLVEEKVPNMKTGKVQTYNRKLKPSEIVMINAELSKMGGDYAPNKVAQTNTNGEDIQEQIDYSKLSTKALKEIAAARKNITQSK